MSDIVQRLCNAAQAWDNNQATCGDLMPSPAMLREAAAEIERLRKDGERMEWLETLPHRAQYMNSRRPSQPVSSDMHFTHGRCSLYVRNLFGNAINGAGGSAESVRATIDAAMKAQT